MHTNTRSSMGGRGVGLTLLLICAGVSVQNIADVSSEADIFELAPCSAGKNLRLITTASANYHH